MANISDAHGYINLSSKDKEALVALIEIFEKYTSKWHYSTILDEATKIEKEDELYKVEVAFTGFGRWAFSSNVENLFTWLLSDEKEDEKLCSLLSKLKHSEFTISFDYVDYEPGCMLFHEVEATLKKKALLKLEDLKNHWDFQIYEIEETAENLVNKLFYDRYYDIRIFEDFKELLHMALISFDEAEIRENLGLERHFKSKQLKEYLTDEPMLKRMQDYLLKGFSTKTFVDEYGFVYGRS